MDHYGFVRVAVAAPKVSVADCGFNVAEIEKLIKQATERHVQIVCFPELSITGYTCGDLFHQQLLIETAETAVAGLLEKTRYDNIIFIVGAPVRSSGKLFNAAIVCQSGKILGIIPKSYLPNHNEFYEKRWFHSGQEPGQKEINFCGNVVPFGCDIIFRHDYFSFGIEICEDLWAAIPPSSYLSLGGAHIIFNLSASNELIGKNNYRKALIQQQSARCLAGYVYASAGWGESTTDVVFSGSGFIYENGVLLSQSERFSLENQLIVNEIDTDLLKADRQKNMSFIPADLPFRFVNVGLSPITDLSLSRKVNPHPFIPSEDQYEERCNEIFSIQTMALTKRMSHIGAKHAIVGVSGGLDSTLALLVCVKTCDKLQISRKNIIGVTMPGYGTTERTYNNAHALMKALGVTIREISIVEACEQHFKDIGHNSSMHDITYENIQARERTQILMGIANQMGGLVIGTGDLSELALGWTTYNGDHMSMYAVNSSIPKTLVRYLVRWVAQTQMDERSQKTLADIIDTPVSPELLPANDRGEIAQKTEDIIGSYELHDFFLYYMLRFGFSPQKIFFLAQQAFLEKYTSKELIECLSTFYHRFFSQQFKRSCMPDGPKVGSINLSPRGDWRMPSDASVRVWLDDLLKLSDLPQ